MAEDKSVAFDLFGDPIRPRREGRGRPEHVWTQENSDKINLLFATGHDIADAAAAIGITQPTLRKHYFSEVEQWRVARLRLRASMLKRLFEAGEKGNVGAIKELFKQAEAGKLQSTAKSIANRSSSPPPAPRQRKPEPIGKKEALKEAAGTITGAGGRLAPSRSPKLPGITTH